VPTVPGLFIFNIIQTNNGIAVIKDDFVHLTIITMLYENNKYRYFCPLS
jgi:hypothetical protein